MIGIRYFTSFFHIHHRKECNISNKIIQTTGKTLQNSRLYQVPWLCLGFQVQYHGHCRGCPELLKEQDEVEATAAKVENSYFCVIQGEDDGSLSHYQIIPPVRTKKANPNCKEKRPS